MVISLGGIPATQDNNNGAFLSLFATPALKLSYGKDHHGRAPPVGLGMKDG